MDKEKFIETSYTVKEEIAHALTHGLGTILSIAGLCILVVYSVLNGTMWHVVSSSIYGATLIILYSASTFYHGATNAKMKTIFQQVDHAAIYLLIAGTYTPFTLGPLRGNWGWTLFGIVWAIAIFGIIAQFVNLPKVKKFSLLLYIVMGWMVVIAAKPLYTHIELGGLALLIGGGVFYSLGIIFYVWKKLNYNHAIWHLFVMAGSILHFFSVLYYVIP